MPTLIAHRLGRAYGPDSSSRALAGALAGGVDALETDVCLTADEQLVCLHDPLLPLGSTLGGWASERSAAEIRSSWLIGADGNPTDQHPLTVDELLALIPRDLPLQLEVKAHADPHLAARTARLICDRHGPRERHRLEVISFHSTACATAAARGVRSRLVIWADGSPGQIGAWARSRGVYGVSVEHFLLSIAVARAFRRAGLSVNTGTINNVELARRVIQLGAPDAICTDRPLELRRELEAAGDDLVTPLALAR
jgi:glycerophosphoryl diester phosphodiesterase